MDIGVKGKESVDLFCASHLGPESVASLLCLHLSSLLPRKNPALFRTRNCKTVKGNYFGKLFFLIPLAEMKQV